MSSTVTVREYAGDKLIKTIGNGSQRSLEKMERGLNINLDHENYYTQIEEIESIQDEIDALNA